MMPVLTYVAAYQEKHHNRLYTYTTPNLLQDVSCVLHTVLNQISLIMGDTHIILKTNLVVIFKFFRYIILK